MMIYIRKTAAVMLAILSLLFLAPLAGAEGGMATPTIPPTQSELAIMSYRLLHAGSTIGKLKKGSTVVVELIVKNTALKTSELDQNYSIDVSRLIDSFSSVGNATVEIQSKGDEALQMKLTFPECTYNGSGKQFRFMVGLRKLGEADAVFDQGEINMLECEEYTEPVATSTPTPSTQPVKTIPVPTLRISRSDVPTLSAGDETTATIFFTNMGGVSMEDALMTISVSEALLMMENASSFPIGSLLPGRTVGIPVRIKAAKTITSEQQAITVEAKFYYFNGDTRAQGTATDKLTLLAKSTVPDANRPDGPQPNIILQNYTFGDGSGQAAAGSEFDLSLDFMNTSSKKKVENVVLTIEPGEGLSLSNSSNTFYFESIGQGEAKSESVKLLSLPTAKPGVAQVTLTFRYEYVEISKRVPVTVTQKLSIQLFQPDRFDVKLNTLPDDVTVGAETTVSLNYMNKGKSEVSNVQVKLEGEVSAIGTIQNIGNLEPGKSGNINFVITPQEAGDVKCTAVISYEDASGKSQTKEIPIAFTAKESDIDINMGDEAIEAEETSKNGALLWYIIGGLLAVGVGITIIVKKRATKKKGRKSSYEWKDEEEV